MNTKKRFFQVIGLVFMVGLLAGCGSTPAQPTPVPTAVPTIAPPPTAAPTAPLQIATITGRVHLVAPPTPRMVVYALDPTTGQWAFTETEATETEATYTLVVQPGSYQVFAFSDIGGYAGYSRDGSTLAFVSVAANQTVSDIMVRPPSQSECGPMFGVPASPDGRFKAVNGPTAGCVVPTPVTTGQYVPVSPEVCQILQESATQALSIPFTVENSAPFKDPLTGETGQGCLLTATGNGNHFSDPVTPMTNLMASFVGWTEQPQYQANGPTGAATGMTRDMGLLLITVGWKPAPEVQCPNDQPISACVLTPEQKIYTIQIQAAQK